MLSYIGTGDTSVLPGVGVAESRSVSPASIRPPMCPFSVLGFHVGLQFKQLLCKKTD